MTNIDEIFVDIIGLENYYQVSNLGTVISKDRVITFSDGRKRFYKSIKVKQKKTVYGYMVAPVAVNRKAQHLFVHRLIAIHFIPNPDNKPFINHIDCNKSNNSIDNLEWCTHKENSIHAQDNGLYTRGEDHFKTNISKEDVLYIKASKERGCDLAKKFNITPSSVCDIRKGNTWTWLNR